MSQVKTELYQYSGLIYALDEAQLPTEGARFARTCKIAGTHIVRIGEDVRFTGLGSEEAWADLTYIDPEHRQAINCLKVSDPPAVDSANLTITWDSDQARWIALVSGESSVLDLPVKGHGAEARRQTILILNELQEDEVIYAYDSLPGS
ncbi:hypothetical protein HY948_00250 [Candidatus Gottesmanbacteria bacterium]|nr:hypothetical protein [Candidatus Gottesmanbacteria bacterium]